MSLSEIAVIVPNYQRGNSLSEACATILDQTHPPQEIVVVDDGSTQDLRAVREKLESHGVAWISLKENRGPAAARNAGVAATVSPWISFLDSDDSWEREKLAIQADWHGNHPEIRISQVRENWVRDGQILRKPAHWEPGEGDLFAASVERCSIGPSCVMMHRSLWNEVGGFDPRYRVCEDYALWLEVTRQERVGKVSGEALVKKAGGRDDQLSLITPAMDRYRVAALLEMLERDQIRPEQRDLVKEGLRRKCRILAEGAEKRDQFLRAKRYRNIADRVLCENNETCFSELVAEAWIEIEESESI